MPAFSETFWQTILVAAIAGVPAIIIAIGNARKLQDVHKDVNNRMTEMIALSKEAAGSTGELKGRKETENKIPVSIKDVVIAEATPTAPPTAPPNLEAKP